MPRRPGGKESLGPNEDNEKKVDGGEFSKQPYSYKTSWKWEKLPMTTAVLFLG